MVELCCKTKLVSTKQYYVSSFYLCCIVFIAGDISYVVLNDNIHKEFFLIEKEREEKDIVSEKEEILPESIAEEGTARLWTRNATVFLITKIKELGDKFDSEVKKCLYLKLATTLQKEFNRQFTAAQVESKWKALKRTYV